MGANPSKDLYFAARKNDIAGMQAAKERQGDVNYRHTKFQQTPLIAAAKHGHAKAVQWLLNQGALDWKDSKGNTALIHACGAGHAAAAAVLLDRGSDHFQRNASGETALDLAARNGHTRVVRLLEARTAVFFAEADEEVSGWFSTYWQPRWISVSRARPYDNPAVPRDVVQMSIYSDHTAYAPLCDLWNPRVEPLSTDAKGDVVCQLQSARQLAKGRPTGVKPHKIKLSREMYEWLQRVLSDEFGTGRGNAFDAYGLVRTPPAAAVWQSQYSTHNFDPSLSAPVRLQSEQAHVHQLGAGATPGRLAPATAAAVAAATMAGAGAVHVMRMPPGPVPAPIRAPMPLVPVVSGSVGMGYPVAAPVRPVGSGTGAEFTVALPPATATASTAAAAPATGTVAALQAAIDAGTIEFDGEPPEEFLCSITTDLLLDPVVAADGHSYSRAGITEWMRRGRRTSPRTNEPLADERLVPNHTLRAQVLEWIEAHRLDRRLPSRQAASAAAAAAASAASVRTASAISASAITPNEADPTPNAAYDTVSNTVMLPQYVESEPVEEAAVLSLPHALPVRAGAAPRVSARPTLPLAMASPQYAPAAIPVAMPVPAQPVVAQQQQQQLELEPEPAADHEEQEWQMVPTSFPDIPTTLPTANAGYRPAQVEQRVAMLG